VKASSIQPDFRIGCDHYQDPRSWATILHTHLIKTETSLNRLPAYTSPLVTAKSGMAHCNRIKRQVLASNNSRYMGSPVTVIAGNTSIPTSLSIGTKAIRRLTV
jgi:hypothetical protein